MSTTRRSAGPGGTGRTPPPSVSTGPKTSGFRRFFTGGLPDETLLAEVAAATQTPVSVRELARLRRDAGTPAHRAGHLLEAAGAVRLTDVIEPVAGAPSPADAALKAIEIATHNRSVERSRLEMMRRYAELTDCRRRFLLRYFGQGADDPCGRCDNCDAGRSTPAGRDHGAFGVGMRVEHQEWGRGVVLADAGGRLTVFFDNVGYRELLTEAVLNGTSWPPSARPPRDRRGNGGAVTTVRCPQGASRRSGRPPPVPVPRPVARAA